MGPEIVDRPLREPLRSVIVSWCLVSATAVVLTGDVPVWLAVVVIGSILAFGFSKSDAHWLRPIRTVSSGAAILYLLFFPIDWFFLSERLIFAVVHLIFYLKLHTLLTLKTRRDRSRLYGLCLFEMLAAASMTVDVLFVAPLALFVVLGALALLLDETLSRTEADPGLIAPAVRAACGLGAAILMVAGGVFLLIPRLGEGGFRLGGVRGVTSTGISDHVELGDFGTIQQSQEVVMRVVSSAPVLRSPSRWRGSAFDRYENGKWLRSLSGTQLLSESGPQEFFLAPPEPSRLASAAQSEVFLEPLDTDVLFMPPGSLQLKASVRYVYVDRYLSLRAGRVAAGRRYVVRWDAGPGAETEAWGGRQPLLAAHRPFYLQMPLLSRDFNELAERVVPEGIGATRAASAAELYLRTNYTYTLQTPSRKRDDPLEDFLFEARAGHCEYFATAMVMLLRRRDVPARLVTGFLRGEPNEVGNFEVIRKSRAHAWVEAFDPGRGWLTFDPTPPGAVGEEATRTFGFLTAGADSLRMLWDKYVITYDRERQRGVVGDWRGVATGVVAAARSSAQSVRRHLTSVALAALVLLAGAVGLRLLIRRYPLGTRLRWSLRRGRLKANRPESAVKFYAALLERLEKLGFTKPPGVTPAEYARAHEPRLPGLVDLTSVYYQIRYGGRTLDRDELARAERLAIAIQVAAWSSGDIAERATARR